MKQYFNPCDVADSCRNKDNSVDCKRCTRNRVHTHLSDFFRLKTKEINYMQELLKKYSR